MAAQIRQVIQRRALYKVNISMIDKKVVMFLNATKQLEIAKIDDNSKNHKYSYSLCCAVDHQLLF